MPHQDRSSISCFKQINPEFQYKIIKWYEVGILGIGTGGNPFFDLSDIINVDSTQARDVEQELLQIIKNPKVSHHAYNSTYVPEDINNQKYLTYYVWRAEQYIPKNIRASLKTNIEITSYVYNTGLAKPSWNNMTFIMRPNLNSRNASGAVDFTKIQSNGERIENTPLLDNWIKSWNIFDEIGRIVIFENSKNNPVCIHRDSGLLPSKIHHISIQFTKNRPAFVYDEIKKEKIYYNCPVYTFNAADNHGVDTESENKFTLRIDGVFNPEFCKKLGLIDGYIWTSQYKSGTKLKDIQIFEPDERP